MPGPFSGVFANLPGVSCDNFAGVNEHSDQFFLTHCHADHMVGLDKLVLLLRRKNLMKVNHKIFCSSITKSFLVRKHGKVVARFIADLAPNEATLIRVFDKGQKAFYNLRVTAIPANHCPGSVMFLFETLKAGDGDDDDDEVSLRILHTGDFRLENVSLSSLTALHDIHGEPLRLDLMYLDTTFCSRDYETFPARDEALEAIWQLVDGWVRKNGMYRHQRPRHVVLFHLPAQYGSEPILASLNRRSGGKWKIHVGQHKHEDYLSIVDLKGCTDSEFSNATWIHACSFKDPRHKVETPFHMRSLPCHDGPFEVRQIKHSAMFFTKDRLSSMHQSGQPFYTPGGEFYRVCYSCHSSLNELLSFVEHFQPKAIVPIVLPQNMSESQVMTLLSSVMKKQQPGESSMISLDLGDTPPNFEVISPNDSLELLKTPPPKKAAEKRKLSVTGENEVEVKRFNFDDSSVEEEDSRSPTLEAVSSKRLQFRSSRMDRVACSMPVKTSMECDDSVRNAANRRASLPHNLKIPAITITPSTPSPDPNHPDYPEFFEDRIYLETRHQSLTMADGSSQSDSIRLEYEDDSDEDNEVIMLDSHESEIEDPDSTPDLEEVYASAKTEEERRTVSRFMEKNLANDHPL